METWAAEIKLRAQRRIGEISRELEKARPAGGKGNVVLPQCGSTKTAALQAAGLTPQAAHRCEQIAAIPERRREANAVITPTPPGATLTLGPGQPIPERTRLRCRSIEM